MNSKITPEAGDALLVVDVQNDFLPGGNLGVPDGDAVIPVLNRYIETFAEKGLPIFFTRDWHPEKHCSFEAQGGPWPVHCLADSEGAAFAADLAMPDGAVVVSKARSPDKDAYSGFEGTDLAARLRARGANRVFIGGLATDYCVLNTVMDALSHGFEVCLLEDAIRAVNVDPGDGAKAVAKMTDGGARRIDLEMLEDA